MIFLRDDKKAISIVVYNLLYVSIWTIFKDGCLVLWSLNYQYTFFEVINSRIELINLIKLQY